MKIAICLFIAGIVTAAQGKSVVDILHYKEGVEIAKSKFADQTLLTQDVCKLTPGNWLDLEGFFKEYAKYSVWNPNGTLDYARLMQDLTKLEYENVLKSDFEENNLCVKIPKFYKNYVLLTGECSYVEKICTA